MTFEEYVRKRTGALLGLAVAASGDRHLAEDVVQDVLVKAHRHWPRIGGLDLPEAYVRRMVVNEYVSWRRKWARVVPRADVDQDADRARSVPDHAGRLADRADVEQRLATLPARQRAVLVLRYFEQLTDGEIADVLACNVGTVRGYASRALATLRIAAADPVAPAVPLRKGDSRA